MNKIMLFILAFQLPLQAETVLWTKTLTDVEQARLRVGSDGTTGIMIATSDHHFVDYIWLNRDGEVIAEINPTHSDSTDVIVRTEYVSLQEVILSMAKYDEFGQFERTYLELFQKSSEGQIAHRVIQAKSMSGATSNVLNYPYYLAQVIDGNTHTYTFYELTDENAVKVVGDAVIGVHGSNLKVRWKTVANAKYKVQSSTDLNTWTDYTEIIDGNGSTMIVNIPLDEDVDAKYARVVKL